MIVGAPSEGIAAVPMCAVDEAGRTRAGGGGNEEGDAAAGDVPLFVEKLTRPGMSASSARASTAPLRSVEERRREAEGGELRSAALGRNGTGLCRAEEIGRMEEMEGIRGDKIDVADDVRRSGGGEDKKGGDDCEAISILDSGVNDCCSKNKGDSDVAGAETSCKYQFEARC